VHIEIKKPLMIHIMEQKKIVVVGYGGGGSKLVAALAKKKKYDITVITPFDYMEVSLLMTKVIATDGEEHQKALFPLLKEDGVTYVKDACASVEANSVTTQSGRSIPFDVCVVAVGQNIPIFYPTAAEDTIEKRKESIAAIQAKVRNAKTIVISGGGPVGTEAAADIKLRFKDKK
jgi:NADH dehydrogenase FAD-containing subunit